MSKAPTLSPDEIILRHKSSVDVPAVPFAVTSPMALGLVDLLPIAIILSFLALKWLLVVC